MAALCLTSAKADAAALETCLRQIAARDTAALAELYRRTSAAVYGFSLSIVKNAHDAEDILHDCYLSVYSSAAGYRPDGKPMAWLFTIARNLCLMRLRERGRSEPLPDGDWPAAPGADGTAGREDRLVLDVCLGQLSDEERQIVVLHAVAGFRHREIAALLELPLPTVLSKYSRALKKLKALLTKGERTE